MRQALNRLAHEGLLEALPAGGFTVRQFTLEDIWDAIEIRGTLEGIAARLAAQRITDASDLAKLRKCCGEMEHLDLTRLTEFVRYLELNEAFHVELRRLARSPILERSIDIILALPFAAPGALVFGEAEQAQAVRSHTIALEHHRSLVEAIEERDGGRAESLAREHSRVARKNLMRALQDELLLRKVPGASLISMPVEPRADAASPSS